MGLKCVAIAATVYTKVIKVSLEMRFWGKWTQLCFGSRDKGQESGRKWSRTRDGFDLMNINGVLRQFS